MTSFKLTAFLLGLVTFLLASTVEAAMAHDMVSLAASHENAITFLINPVPQPSINTGSVMPSSIASTSTSTASSTSIYSPIGIPKPTGVDPFPIVPPSSFLTSRTVTATTSTSVTGTNTVSITDTSTMATAMTDITSVTASALDYPAPSTSTQTVYPTTSIENGLSYGATPTSAQTTKSGAENNPNENGTSSMAEWYDKEGKKTFLLSMLAAVFLHFFG